MCTMCMEKPVKAEEDVRSARSEITESDELPDVGAGNPSGPLEDHQVLLTTESSFKSP